jgi:hypothetical protein
MKKTKESKGLKKKFGDKPKIKPINKDEAFERMWSDNDIIGSDYGKEKEEKGTSSS